MVEGGKKAFLQGKDIWSTAKRGQQMKRSASLDAKNLTMELCRPVSIISESIKYHTLCTTDLFVCFLSRPRPRIQGFLRQQKPRLRRTLRLP